MDHAEMTTHQKAVANMPAIHYLLGMSATTKLLRDRLSATVGNSRVREDEPLAKHCNWRVGGPADIFYKADSATELETGVRLARELNLPFTILGFGANILVSDFGIRGLVILNRSHRIAFLPAAVVEADSGTNLAVLAKEAARQGIGGLEFLVGIPGTVGAAVAVNAGTRTEWISAILDSALVLKSSGETDWLPAEALDFSYRSSRLKESGEVVLAARLKGRPCEPEVAERNMADHLRVRKTQPTGPSTGSVFTNPDGDFAGRLIEAAGLKGFQVGGAQVSEMHANFIMNVGGAKAQDMQRVITHVKMEVEKRFGIRLQEEIRYLGDWQDQQ